MAFERVVDDYYDGERLGIADYGGQPHHYCRAKDDYGETFVLTPIDQETLTLAMERWAMWLDWQAASNRGEVPQSTHPALAGNNPRYAELEAALAARTSLQAIQAKRARPVFREPGVTWELELEWTGVAETTRGTRGVPA